MASMRSLHTGITPQAKWIKSSLLLNKERDEGHYVAMMLLLFATIQQSFVIDEVLDVFV